MRPAPPTQQRGPKKKTASSPAPIRVGYIFPSLAHANAQAWCSYREAQFPRSSPRGPKQKRLDMLAGSRLQWCVRAAPPPNRCQERIIPPRQAQFPRSSPRGPNKKTWTCWLAPGSSGVGEGRRGGGDENSSRALALPPPRCFPRFSRSRLLMFIRIYAETNMLGAILQEPCEPRRPKQGGTDEAWRMSPKRHSKLRSLRCRFLARWPAAGAEHAVALRAATQPPCRGKPEKVEPPSQNQGRKYARLTGLKNERGWRYARYNKPPLSP